MQLHIEYALLANQIFTALHNQQFKYFNHKCLMPIAHSVFKQNCSQCQCPPAAATHDRNLLQNDTIALSMNSCRKLFCRGQNGLLSQHYVGQLWHVCLIVF